MNTERLQQLFQEYNSVLDMQKFNARELDYSRLEHHIQRLQALDVLETSSMYIMDMYKRDYAYLSSRFYHMFGFDIEEAYKEGPSFLDRKVHPDDMVKMLEMGNYFMRYAFNLSSDELRESKLIADYRMQNSKGDYIRVIKQYIALELCPQGNIWLSLCAIDISPDSDLTTPLRCRLVNLRTGALFSFPPPQTNQQTPQLSGRETQILQLIANGLISKEIADHLFISVNTVNTHRQRIIEKLNVSNTFEAIRYASNLGLLQHQA